ncbi:MAG TPA: SxtJ family membrane protein [Candidatus Acidoferrum sp.]|nr:SxtJ family membrane protein [Candidatus Acidoferrum sp.]
MLNPFKDVQWNPDFAARRSFGRSLMIGFPMVALVLLGFAKGTSHEWKTFPLWIGGIGSTVGLVLWLLPRIAKPFYVSWYFFGCCIGFVIGNLLFAAFYFLVMTPIGLLLRALGRDPLRRRFDKSAATYWKDSEKVADTKSYHRQF